MNFMTVSKLGIYFCVKEWFETWQVLVHVKKKELQFVLACCLVIDMTGQPLKIKLN